MSVVIDGSSGITTNSGTVVSTTDATLNGLTVGKGGGSVTQNTVVGASAGSANTTGKITAVGYLAARFNTTGSGNTAIGGNDAAQDGALYYNTTGNYNIAVGTGSVASNTTGSSNTGIGYSALQNNNTGSNNTAVGYQAGYGSTADSNNTYVGYTCGSSVSGGGNVMFGPSTFSGYNGSNQVACKVGNGREAFYADIGAGGSFRQYSNSSTWATTSDQRVKENIVEITTGLEKIVALRPVEFDYITSKEHNIGFIAQEFITVLPDQVKKVKARQEEAELVGEDEIYSIQQNLVPYLVKAVQELKAIIDAQAVEIAELKAQK